MNLLNVIQRSETVVAKPSILVRFGTFSHHRPSATARGFLRREVVVLGFDDSDGKAGLRGKAGQQTGQIASSRRDSLSI